MAFQSMENISNTIKNLKDILSNKKSISFEYLEMIQLATNFSDAVVRDELRIMNSKGQKEDPKETSKLFHKSFQFHIDNQIKMFISKK